MEVSLPPDVDGSPDAADWSVGLYATSCDEPEVDGLPEEEAVVCLPDEGDCGDEAVVCPVDAADDPLGDVPVYPAEACAFNAAAFSAANSCAVKVDPPDDVPVDPDEACAFCAAASCAAAYCAAVTAEPPDDVPVDPGEDCGFCAAASCSAVPVDPDDPLDVG